MRKGKYSFSSNRATNIKTLAKNSEIHNYTIHTFGLHVVPWTTTNV